MVIERAAPSRPDSLSPARRLLGLEDKINKFSECGSHPSALSRLTLTKRDLMEIVAL